MLTQLMRCGGGGGVLLISRKPRPKTPHRVKNSHRVANVLLKLPVSNTVILKKYIFLSKINCNYNLLIDSYTTQGKTL